VFKLLLYRMAIHLLEFLLDIHWFRRGSQSTGGDHRGTLLIRSMALVAGAFLRSFHHWFAAYAVPNMAGSATFGQQGIVHVTVGAASNEDKSR
jgi:hypothetical protein